MNTLKMMIKLMNEANVSGDDTYIYIDTPEGTLILPKAEKDMPIRIIDEDGELVWIDNI